jgi:hypothetical protein
MSINQGARQVVSFVVVLLLAASSAMGQAPTPTPNGPPILAFRPVDADGCSFCCSFSCQMTPTPTPHLDPQGRQIFTRNQSGFIFVLEGSSAVGTEGTYQVNATSGARTFVPINHSSGRPSVQLLLQNGTGNESPEVCDIAPPNAGGVPGFDPPDFNLGVDPPNTALKNAVTDAIKDMACRFDSVTSSIPCTRNRFGDFAFLAAGTVRQFCYAVPSVASFENGDTIVAAQFRGTNGNLGPREEIVIRVGDVTPTFTPTPTPTPVIRRIAGRVRYYSADQPVPAVSVELSGPAPTSMWTDGNGQYDFSPLDAGTWVTIPNMTGGAASAISSLDAAHVLQKTVGLRTFTALQNMAGDVTGNGSISSLDAARILQFKVGILPRFDVANTCLSDWVFFPMPGPAQNQTMSNPVISPGNCGGSITLNPLVGAALAQDFYGVAFGDVTGNWMPPAPASGASVRTRASTGIVRFGQTKARHRRRVTVPVSVETSAPFSSLDLEIGYDPNRFRAIRARAVGEGRRGILQANTDAPGLIRLSMASGRPMVGGPDSLVELEFQVLRRVRGSAALRTWSAVIDDRPVQTVHE